MGHYRLDLDLDLSMELWEHRQCEVLFPHRLVIAVMDLILTYHCLTGVITMGRIITGLDVMMKILSLENPPCIVKVAEDSIADLEGQALVGMVL